MRLKKFISGVLAGLTAISSIPFSSAGVIAAAADEEKDIWDGTTDTHGMIPKKQSFIFQHLKNLQVLQNL